MASQHPLRDMLNRSASSKHARKKFQNRLVKGASAGNLSALAKLAENAAENEKHYSGSLKRLMTFKKASKKRTDKNQAKFSWREEQKRLKTEAKHLWRDIIKAMLPKKLRSESKEFEKAWASQEKELFDQMEKLKEFVQSSSASPGFRTAMSDGKPAETVLEIGAILADFQEANGIISDGLEEELETCIEDVNNARNAVFSALKETGNGSGAFGGIPGRSDIDCLKQYGGDVWKAVEAVPYAGEMEPSVVFEICQRLEAHQGKVHKEISALKGRTKEFETAEKVVAGLGGAADPAGINGNQKTPTAFFKTAVPEEAGREDKQESERKIATKRLFGGWEERSHDLFVKAWRESIARGKSKHALYKSVRIVCPEQNLEDIRSHSQEYEKWRFAKKEIKDKRVAWMRTVKEELEHCKVLFAGEAKRKREQLAQFERLQAQELKRSELHDLLSQLRSKFEEKQRVKMAEANRLKAIQDKEDALHREKEDLEHAKNKRLAQEYQEKKKREQEHAAYLKMQQEEEEILAKKLLAPMLKDRVNYREKMISEKNEQRKVRLHELISEKEHREEILRKLKATCPYAEKLEQLHDPERLFQATKAFEAAVAELDYLLANPEDNRLAKPLNGFNSKKITTDIRYRLAARLTTAGLQATPYAQALMLKMARSQPVHRVSQAGPFRPIGIVNHSSMNY